MPIFDRLTPGDLSQGGDFARKGVSVLQGWSHRKQHLSKLSGIIDKVDTHFGGAGKPKEMCSSIREINDSIPGKGATVIHAQHHRSMVGEVGYADQRAQWKAAVGAGKPIHIVIFAACGRMALKQPSIPRCAADLIPMVLLLRRWYGGLFCVTGLRAGYAKHGHQRRTGKDHIASGASSLFDCDSFHNPPTQIVCSKRRLSQTIIRIYLRELLDHAVTDVISRRTEFGLRPVIARLRESENGPR
jgi:hypothetical protein